MRIVCLSDTHYKHEYVDMPEGDVLVFAGDMLGWGSRDELVGFNEWLGRLDFPYIIVVAGNHDFACEKYPNMVQTILSNAIYLQDYNVDIGGLSFYGSPWQPEFGDWAFNLPRKGHQLSKKWEDIPTETDVLITHSPPHGILDKSGYGHFKNPGDANCGCELLRLEVLGRIKPKLHVFGHIHEAAGKLEYRHSDGETVFVNAAFLSRSYEPANQPIVVEI